MTLKIRQAKLLGKRDEFIEENLRLVTSVCRHFIHVASTKGMDFDDIFSIGSIGLVKAYDKFDLDYRTPQGKPVQFSTYAVPMISGEIRRWIRDTNYIKISRAIKDILYKILHFGLEDSSPELLAEKFDVKLKDAEEALKLFHTGSIRSLQEEISNDTDKSITLADSLATAVNDDYSYMEMEEFLKSLPLHIRHVVRLRYMKDLRQGEIAKIIGKSQAQVSRLLIRAKKLAKKYYSLKGEDNMPTPEQTSKVMDLLRTTNKSYKEIAEETEVKYATVAYYGMKIRGKVRPKKPNLSSQFRADRARMVE
jgi:RNA polymerase sporulation-specific sigma factor